MSTLHDILFDLNNDELNTRLKILGIKPASPRKADLIAALKAALHGDSLKQIWASLEALEQAAVAEVAYAPDLVYRAWRIKAKHGEVPAFDRAHENKLKSNYSSKSKKATRINLFLFRVRYSQGERSMPSDLAEEIRGFVPEPEKFRVATIKAPVEEDGLFVRQTEHEALAEVIALLRLADQGKLSISAKTGQVPPAGCRRIVECLIGGDFFPPELAYRPDKKSYEQEIGPIKPVAWARLLQTAKYFTQTGSKSKLTPAGVKALSQAPHEVIRKLWLKWLANTDYDEFNRIEAIKGQKRKGHMTAKPERRDTIEDALIDCPVGKWITIDKFSDFMLGAGFEFDVSRDLWKLYIGDAQYGSLGYAGCGDWNIVQLRYIFCFLFEYAATLGLIDIAYVHPQQGLDDFYGQWGADYLKWLSRYDGLRAFRITKLGAYCLGMTAEFEQTMPGSSLKLTVLPSLRVQVQSGHLLPAEKLQLETWAEPIEAHTWKLDTDRALDAVERGQSAADFADFLRQRDNQELPETVEGFLRDCEQKGKALQNSGEATLIRCRDPETANLVCAQKELQGQCHRCGETLLAVTTTQLPKFRKVARTLGLGFV